MLLGVLDGAVVDSGTALEIGFAAGLEPDVRERFSELLRELKKNT
jgi:nucleoside 2-deoxyribosyltransferase